MSEKTFHGATSEGLTDSPSAARQTLSQERLRLYEFGPFRLDPTERILLRGNEIVPLTPKAFDTLHLLVRNSGHLMEKEELIRTLWPETFVEEGSLSNNIFLLRKALGEDQAFIETVPRRGYRFVGAVLQLPSPPTRHNEKSQLELASPAVQHPSSIAVPPGPSPLAALPTIASLLSWRKLIVPLTAGAGCIALGFLVYLKWPHPKPEQPLAAVPLTALPGWADFPAISPDGSRVVFEWTGEQNFTAFDLYVKSIGNEKLLRLTSDPALHLAPTWSPDGRQIAFQRIAKDGPGIYVVPAQGGAVRKLRSTNASFDLSMHISWSPDGRTIAFADSPFPGGHKRLQLLSLETLQSTPIEHNDKCVEEVLPAFSPDGKQLAYACSLSSREGGFGLSIVTADGRAPRIIKESSGWLKGLDWLPDSKTLLFAEFQSSESVLHELDVATGAETDRIVRMDSHFSSAFSLRAGRLVYVLNTSAKSNIWQGDLRHPDAPPVKLISTTRDQGCPRYSPDGKHIAFSSDRGGAWEIWMSDPDGQNVVQLTNLKNPNTGTPNWSPDSTRIVFDSHTRMPDGQIRVNVYVVNVFERVPRELTTGTPGAFTPSWSHDGKWIYFAGGNDDTAGERIYRVPPQGAEAEVLTTARGYWPLESADGQAIYFAENSGTRFTLHVASLNPTGTESQVEDMPVMSFLANWDIVPSGVYFFPSDDILTLHYFDFSTRKARPVFKISGGGAFPGLSVSPDGRYILYPELDDYRSDIMLVDNFH